MDEPCRLFTIRGEKFWSGPEVSRPKVELRATGEPPSGLIELQAPFGRIGSLGQQRREIGSVKFIPDELGAWISFEGRSEHLEASSLTEALEKFLSDHVRLLVRPTARTARGY